jgi:hypothetical protein
MLAHKRSLGLVALLSAAVTCSFPTDESDQVFVTISTQSAVVRRGEKLAIYARMYHAQGSDTTEIQNVRFTWSTDDPDIATVQAGGLGGAEVTGVNSGVVNLTARAVSFEQAGAGVRQLRVSAPLEIDSIVPDTVRYGQGITIYGIGVDSLFQAQIGSAPLIEHPFTRLRDAQGYSQITYWVPPPARSDSVFFIGNGVFGFAETTFVRPFDYLEPNNLASRSISLEAPPQFPLLPFIRFYNPALAFELLPRDEPFGADWYRLQQTTPRDLTIIIQGEEVRGTFSTFLTDSLYWDNSQAIPYLIGPDSWTLGPESHFCHGQPFEPLEGHPDSTVVALRNFAGNVLHALALYSQPGRYGFTVIEGYVTERNGFPPDAQEEDDYCSAADAKGRPFPPSVRDLTRTIDNGHDVDWTAFQVPATGLVRFRTAVTNVATADTLTDIDLYVLTLPGGGASATLDVMGSGINVGSNEDFTLLLGPGEYYAVVVDYAGVPTPYALCVASCADPFPSAVGGSVTSPSVEQPRTAKAKSRGPGGAARPRPGSPRRVVP